MYFLFSEKNSSRVRFLRLFRQPSPSFNGVPRFPLFLAHFLLNRSPTSPQSCQMGLTLFRRLVPWRSNFAVWVYLFLNRRACIYLDGMHLLLTLRKMQKTHIHKNHFDFSQTSATFDFIRMIHK